MKKLINNVDDVLTESLRGFEAACGDVVRLHRDPVFLSRVAPAPDGKVALVSGGGSGHEPLHGGFVGMGMLDAACPGQVFTSPTPDQMLAAAQAVDRGAGTLFIVKTTRRRHELRDGGGDVRGHRDHGADQRRRRGGGQHLHDPVGGGSPAPSWWRRSWGRPRSRARDLEACRALGVRINERTASMGVALTSCTVPEAGRPTFDIDDDEIEMGVGIHGEPGRKRLPMASADEIASQLVQPILNELSPADGDRALLLVNGFGASPLMELTLMYDAARRAMTSSGVEVVRSLVGNYVTSSTWPAAPSPCR